MAKTLADFKAAHDPETIIAQLRSELSDARSQAVTASAMREWIGKTSDDLTSADIPKWLASPKKVGAPGVPTIQFSDFHWGERVDPRQVNGVNAFNMEIARKRLQHTVLSAIKLARILDPEMRYPGVVVQCLGDMISGNIHDELVATNEMNTMPTMLDLYRHLGAAITLLADTFGRVFVPCVSGNHGRDTRKTWAKDRNHTSFDWLLYQFLSIRFADDKRVQFHIPDGADGSYKVYGLDYLITHGDQFKAGDSIIGPLGPTTRGDQKKLAARSAMGLPYDVMCFGHWHTRILRPRLRGNGTLKGWDEYAMQGNFGFEPPSQNFWITHPDMGITFDAPLFCDESPIRRPSEWVKWQQ